MISYYYYGFFTITIPALLHTEAYINSKADSKYVARERAITKINITRYIS